jgi:pimeloyl-ACP methyl ester carboxylesterase
MSLSAVGSHNVGIDEQPRGSHMSEPTTQTLDVPGAVLTYDVRPSDGTDHPALMLIGSPMGAGGFGTLAGHFTDRTVVTYDPRGVERSRRTDGASTSNPDEHADDIHRVIEALGMGAVDLFASSGGAINALALVARHPDDVRTLVAHEPPAAALLPDREAALAASRDIHETYLRNGLGAAMAKFIAVVSHTGPIPADFAERPAPDPAMFGLPTDDDGSRDDVLVGQNIVSSTHYEPDFEALRAASTRIVVAAGAESDGSSPTVARTPSRSGSGPASSRSRAATPASSAVSTGEPDAFAALLRETLAAASTRR